MQRHDINIAVELEQSQRVGLKAYCNSIYWINLAVQGLLHKYQTSNR